MTPQLFVGASLGAGLNKLIENNQELPSIFDIILTPDIYVPVIGMIILVLIGFI
ncbi:membrane protein, partial [Pelagibacteraceae bacterium GOM-A4]